MRHVLTKSRTCDLGTRNVFGLSALGWDPSFLFCGDSVVIADIIAPRYRCLHTSCRLAVLRRSALLRPLYVIPPFLANVWRKDREDTLTFILVQIRISPTCLLPSAPLSNLGLSNRTVMTLGKHTSHLRFLQKIDARARWHCESSAGLLLRDSQIAHRQEAPIKRMRWVATCKAPEVTDEVAASARKVASAYRPSIPSVV